MGGTGTFLFIEGSLRIIYFVKIALALDPDTKRLVRRPLLWRGEFYALGNNSVLRAVWCDRSLIRLRILPLGSLPKKRRSSLRPKLSF